MAAKEGTEAIEVARQTDLESADEKKASRDVDDALRFTLESTHTTWTEDEEKKVVRKIDAVVLSMVCRTLLPSPPCASIMWTTIDQ